MILIDTSVWIDFLRHGDSQVVRLLEENAVYVHPLVVGEIALGRFGNRDAVLEWLQQLAPVVVATSDEVLHLIDTHGLHGSGIGIVDAHLLASARLTLNTLLWTRDRRLAAVATNFGLGAEGLF